MPKPANDNMSTENPETSVPAAEAQPEAAPANNKIKKGTILFTALKDADDSLVPQAAEIVKIVREAGGTLSKKELVAALGTRIQSKQAPGRVLSFYKGALIKNGFITVAKAE